MASGTCLVASDVGGPRWLLKDGGILVEAGNQAAWAHHLDRVLRHTELRRNLPAKVDKNRSAIYLG